ncbi:Crp/Fnr family transcriptional regulator [Fulvimarina sp. MAC3]|uniref:Crp/Fnr family transcriptional regulator n=1 Tax=Fulvimarina sp. MAC3 TaxID=3148887 RepID=UPI0031FD314A
MMKMENDRVMRREVLRGSSLLDGVDDAAIEYLTDYSVIRTFNRGAVVNSMENAATGIVVLIDGKAYVTSYLADGRIFILDMLLSGSLFGLMNLSGASSISMEMVAKTPCVAILIESRAVLDTMERWSSFRRVMWNQALERIADLNAKVICSATPSLPARLATNLLRLASECEQNPGVKEPDVMISQHDLASMLPASREKVNRCLRGWEERGIIEVELGRISILKRGALGSFALCDPLAVED